MKYEVEPFLPANLNPNDPKRKISSMIFALNGLAGFDLHGKTAGICGTGKIGRIVTRILRVWHEGVGVRPYPGAGVPGRRAGAAAHLPQRLITLHQAFHTREALPDIARTTVANLEALAAGKPFVEGSVLT